MERVMVMGVSRPFFLPLCVALLCRCAAAEFDPRLPACTPSSQHSRVLNYFLHDDLDSKPVATAITVVPGVNPLNGGLNPNAFGAIAIFDDAITEGPNVSSKLLGRARGFYMFDLMVGSGVGLEFQFTVVFGNGSAFPGSTLSYKGYDKIDDVVREISVVGGTGELRMARGWAVILTQALNTTNGGAAILNVTSYLYYGCDAQGTFVSSSTKTSPLLDIVSLLATLSSMIFLQAAVV
ncbi:hypothetical protein Mapa_014010 [Marchantia paleacea]|nr:hypothetical protein Mapa_014010 [Marchantia paleacea]